MTLYDAYYADGQCERITMSSITHEHYRIMHGGESNRNLAVIQAQQAWPNRKLVKLVQLKTGLTVWEPPSYQG